MYWKIKIKLDAAIFFTLSYFLNRLKEDNKIHEISTLPSVSSNFLFWLSGFTDAEGNFSIILNCAFVKFRFKILLHIDDIEVLKTIRSELGIRRIGVENSCFFIVEKYTDIKNVICPIFKLFPLYTTKRLDFYKAVLIKNEIKNSI